MRKGLRFRLRQKQDRSVNRKKYSWYAAIVKEIFTFIAVLLAIAGNVPYLRDMFRRRVEPHAYTWLVWSLVSGITFFGQVAKGAGVGALPTGASWIFTITIFLFSLRYGLKHITKGDTIFLICALIGMVPWFITKDPIYSVIIAVTIDLIAFIPTIRKTRLHPNTETPTLYGANVLRHVLVLASLQAYNIATTLHSIAMIFTNSLMVLLIVSRKKKHTERSVEVV